jgi:hypothetical protein
MTIVPRRHGAFGATLRAMRRTCVAAAALVGSLFLAAGAQAQVYKWVDEKGVTQYSESPPPDRKASKVAVPDPAPPSRPQAREGPKPWADQELEFRKRQIDRQAGEKTEEQKRLAQVAQCNRARNNLEYQSQGGRFYERNENGEKVYRNDEQQAAVIAAARRRVDEFCR